MAGKVTPEMVAGLQREVGRLRALLTEALDEWTSAYQCESMSEGDRLAEFEQRAHVALAGKGE